MIRGVNKVVIIMIEGFKMQQKSVKYNYIMNIILTLSGFIIPIITFPYVSRILLPIGTGKVSFATSVVAYFSMFAQMGIPTYGIRACAKVRDDKEKLSKTAHEIIIINSIMCILIYIIFLFAVALVPKFREEHTLFLIIGLTIIFNVIGVEWLYKALEQYKYITVRSLIFKVIGIVMMFLFVHEQKDYIVYGGITILGGVGANIFNIINVRKHILIKRYRDYDFLQHLKPIAVFFGLSIATTIYTNVDTVMLGFISGDEEVGYYNAAVKIKTIMVSIITSLGAVLLPRTSYYVDKGLKDQYREITNKAIRFTSILSVSFTIFFCIFAKNCIVFLSGNAYLNSIPAMQIIVFTLPFIGCSNIIGMQILIPNAKEKYYLTFQIVGATIDLIANMILIPKYGSAGAAVGTLLAECIVMISSVFSAGIWVWKIIFQKENVKMIFATTIAIFAASLVKMMGLGNFIELLFAAVIFWGIYGLVLLLLKDALVVEVLVNIIGKIKINKKINQ